MPRRIAERPILFGGLNVVAFCAQSLPVQLIPEESHGAAVGDDVID